MFKCFRTRNQVVLIGYRINNWEMDSHFPSGIKYFSRLLISQIGWGPTYGLMFNWSRLPFLWEINRREATLNYCFHLVRILSVHGDMSLLNMPSNSDILSSTRTIVTNVNWCDTDHENLQQTLVFGEFCIVLGFPVSHLLLLLLKFYFIFEKNITELKVTYVNLLKPKTYIMYQQL